MSGKQKRPDWWTVFEEYKRRYEFLGRHPRKEKDNEVDRRLYAWFHCHRRLLMASADRGVLTSEEKFRIEAFQEIGISVLVSIRQFHNCKRNHR